VVGPRHQGSACTGAGRCLSLLVVEGSTPDEKFLLGISHRVLTAHCDQSQGRLQALSTDTLSLLKPLCTISFSMVQLFSDRGN